MKEKKDISATQAVVKRLLQRVKETNNPYEGFRGENWNVRDWKSRDALSSNALGGLNEPEYHPDIHTLPRSAKIKSLCSSSAGLRKLTCAKCKVKFANENEAYNHSRNFKHYTFFLEGSKLVWSIA